MLITFLGWKFVPESPRWLLSRPNRVRESMEIFQEIAKVNKRPEPQNLESRLTMINEEIMNEKQYGYISLFSSKGLTQKTILMAITAFCSIYTYTQLTLNIGNMGGNTFVNFFLLAMIEGPATYLGLIFAVSKTFNHYRFKLDIRYKIFIILYFLHYLCLSCSYIYKG